LIPSSSERESSSCPKSRKSIWQHEFQHSRTAGRQSDEQYPKQWLTSLEDIVRSSRGRNFKIHRGVTL
jgi:hypothetical protein